MAKFLKLVLVSVFLTMTQAVFVATGYYLMLTLLNTGITWIECFATTMLINIFISHVSVVWRED